jgi:CheY-like chemotaxis protein
LKPIVFCLIDDDEDDREIFQIAVSDIGKPVECLTYNSCIDAIRIFKSKEVIPDFIFLDLNMPHMSGRECLTFLKADEDLNNIPVFIFSTSSFPSDIDDTTKLGAKGFITKPDRIDDLQKLLEELSINVLSNLKHQ